MVRSFISIPAGVFRVRFGRYTVLTLIGSAIWCFALAGCGWAVGKSWERFHSDFRFVDYAVVVAVVAAAAWVVVRWRSPSMCAIMRAFRRWLKPPSVITERSTFW